MGCPTHELDSSVEAPDWALDDPHDQPLETVRTIRSEVSRRVQALFDEQVATH
jgi:hypothetical protein